MMREASRAIVRDKRIAISAEIIAALDVESVHRRPKIALVPSFQILGI
jgi:hypothetical protein